jgi:hypothetical protein
MNFRYSNVIHDIHDLKFVKTQMVISLNFCIVPLYSASNGWISLTKVLDDDGLGPR